MGMLSDDIKGAMQGQDPASLVTCSMDGTPNLAFVSQVYYVDSDHVAVTHQFFNKTVRNIRENPFATIWVDDIQKLRFWVLEVRYDHSETSGPIFEQMEMQLEAIASASGMSEVFKLRAADIFQVLSVREVTKDLVRQA